MALRSQSLVLLLVPIERWKARHINGPEVDRARVGSAGLGVAKGRSGGLPSCCTKSTIPTPSGRAIALLEPHQEIVNLGRLGLRIDVGDAAEDEDELLPLMPEHHPMTSIRSRTADL